MTTAHCGLPRQEATEAATSIAVLEGEARIDITVVDAADQGRHMGGMGDIGVAALSEEIWMKNRASRFREETSGTCQMSN